MHLCFEKQVNEVFQLHSFYIPQIIFGVRG